MSAVPLRPIRPADNQAVARGICEVFEAYGCTGEGYSPQDAEMDDLAGAYSRPGHGYFVLEEDGRVLGGCGFGAYGPPEEGVCELRKLFLLPDARGRGAGEALMLHTLEQARAAGYRRCYLETVARMGEANALYRKHGFEDLDAPLFAGGHHACERWMARALALLALCVLVLMPACAGPGIPSPEEPVALPEIRRELLTMQRESEQLREQMIEKGIANLRLSDVYAQQQLAHRQADRLKEILARHGWPERRLVGRDGATAAYEIAKAASSDRIFQRDCLELMEASWREGQVDAANYAELYDTVCIAFGSPQRYGTQAHIQNGKLEFYPIEKPEQVDLRRAAMGLPPLDEYREQLEEAYLIRPR